MILDSPAIVFNPGQEPREEMADGKLNLGMALLSVDVIGKMTFDVFVRFLADLSEVSPAAWLGVTVDMRTDLLLRRLGSRMSLPDRLSEVAENANRETDRSQWPFRDEH